MIMQRKVQKLVAQNVTERELARQHYENKCVIKRFRTVNLIPYLNSNVRRIPLPQKSSLPSDHLLELRLITKLLAHVRIKLNTLVAVLYPETLSDHSEHSILFASINFLISRLGIKIDFQILYGNTSPIALCFGIVNIFGTARHCFKHLILLSLSL